jgi:hypothetical protein
MFEDLKNLCSQCDDSSSYKTASGTRFVRHLHGEGPLAFLHCLYPPLAKDEVVRCEEALGRALPHDIQRWLEWANGATLFDKTIYLYGYVGQVTRSTRLEEQAPISIIDANEIFSVREPELWKLGWITVGSISGWGTQLTLGAHSSGRCAVVCDQKNFAEYDDFEKILAGIIGRVSPCFTCEGVQDKSYVVLEAALESLLVVPH